MITKYCKAISQVMYHKGKNDHLKIFLIEYMKAPFGENKCKNKFSSLIWTHW